MIEYIFSINAGRSGSNYLEKLFSCVENVSAHHEPQPIMNRDIMISFLNGNSKPLEANIHNKISAISRLKRDKKIYIETNHVFIKSFGWLIPKYIPSENIGIVILKRDKEEIAQSLARINCNAVNNDGRGWLIHITKKNKLVRLPKTIKWPYMTYFFYRILYRIYVFLKSRTNIFPKYLLQKYLLKEPRLPSKINIEFLKWYVDELNEMADEYKKKFPKITYFTVNLYDLNNIHIVKEMFSCFGISSYDKDLLSKTIGTKYNAR